MLSTASQLADTVNPLPGWPEARTRKPMRSKPELLR